MKLFIKILLSVFVALITNVYATSTTVTFPNIQEVTTSLSFQNEIPKTIYKAIKNDEANCCQKEWNLVAYREWGKVIEATAAKGAKGGVTNPVPSRLARVVPGNVSSKTLGAPGANDVFVTAAHDIAGMNASQIADRLTIPNSRSGFRVIEFNTPLIGLASPINRTNPGFVGFGRTAGGAREFVIPNQTIPSGSTIRIIQ